MFENGFPSDWSTLKKLIWLRGSGASGGDLPWQTFTGNPLEFDAVKAHALKSCVVDIEPIQSGSGDPSPDNVRPISGSTGATVWRTGENLCDGIWELGSISATGQNQENSTNIRIKNYIAIPQGSAFTMSWAGGADYILIYAYHADKTFSRYIKAVSNSGSSTTLNADEAYIRFYRYNKTTEPTDFMINIGQALPYSPYSGTSVTVSFGQTVYGGTLDLVSGEGSSEWENIASYNGETITEPWLSSMDKYVSGATPTTGAQVVYKKATGTPFSVTPQDVTAIVGRNVMWTDCNNLTVEAKGTAVTP